MTTIGERLLTLKEYADMSLAQIAREAGYKGSSSVQKYFNVRYDPRELPRDVAERLARAFVGKGNPPIGPEELTALAGEGSEMDKTLAELRHFSHVLHKYIPLLSTKRVSSILATEHGIEVPLFIREHNGHGLYYSTPKHLRHRQIYGIFVSVGNMWPRFQEGEVLLYEDFRPPVPGDDVVITLIDEFHLDGSMIVGRLYLLHDDEVQLDIFSPRGRIIIPRDQVISIKRILTAADMLDAPSAYSD